MTEDLKYLSERMQRNVELWRAKGARIWRNARGVWTVECGPNRILADDAGMASLDWKEVFLPPSR